MREILSPAMAALPEPDLRRVLKSRYPQGVPDAVVTEWADAALRDQFRRYGGQVRGWTTFMHRWDEQEAGR